MNNSLKPNLYKFFKVKPYQHFWLKIMKNTFKNEIVEFYLDEGMNIINAKKDVGPCPIIITDILEIYHKNPFKTSNLNKKTKIH